MALSEKDRDDAREVLKRGWLSIDQVTLVKEAMEKTGMGFREAVGAKGFLSASQVEQLGQPTRPRLKPEPEATSSLYPFLLLTSISMIIAGGIYLYTWVDRRDRLQEKETRDQRREADSLAQTSASRMAATYRKKKEIQRNRLAGEAREEINKAKAFQAKDPNVLENPHYRKAATLYTQALEIFPDALLLEERANAYEMWGAIPEAISDITRAASLAPEKAEYYQERRKNLEKKLPLGTRKE